MKKYWIEYRDENQELHTIGEEPFEGIDEYSAFAEYSRQLVSTGAPAPDRDDYAITEA